MQTLKLSFSLPDATHPHMELHVSSNDSDCDVVIALPMRDHFKGGVNAGPDTPLSAQDEYVLGGYAGI
ncbi:hypothetical protein [Dyella sp. 2HG41-7]|uniref:hypothetical protein n=1 Tax=Dyella sp. 2HG41-7 TaxID=2883239 RepID=UPI001F42C6CA|nr:hypothetical protein [Dyella sp. 2HG41-7]